MNCPCQNACCEFSAPYVELDGDDPQVVCVYCGDWCLHVENMPGGAQLGNMDVGEQLQQTSIRLRDAVSLRVRKPSELDAPLPDDEPGLWTKLIGRG